MSPGVRLLLIFAGLALLGGYPVLAGFLLVAVGALAAPCGDGSFT